MAQFGKDRYKPSGDWVQTTMVETVAGIEHYKLDVLAFCKAVRRAEVKRDSYGLILIPNPDNDYDQFAIEVHGFAAVSGWFKKSVRTWKLGFLPADLAKQLNHDLISQGIPLAIELYHIYQSDSDFVEIKLIVLAPPGNSFKVRISRSQSRRGGND